MAKNRFRNFAAIPNIPAYEVSLKQGYAVHRGCEVLVSGFVKKYENARIEKEYHGRSNQPFCSNCKRKISLKGKKRLLKGFEVRTYRYDDMSSPRKVFIVKETAWSSEEPAPEQPTSVATDEYPPLQQ